jgi:DNA replicative helicase MCM subunit Mcm2 (Cdc46/Mcm family)
MKDKLEKFLHRKEILKELRRLAAAGQKSLVVEFEQLLEFDMELSKALLEGPNDFLEASDAVLTEITKLPGMRLRVKGLDKSMVIRDIRAAQVGKFIQVEGILTRSSEVKPEVKEAVFKCLRCGELNHVMQIDEVFREPLVCENPNCNMRGPFKLEVESSEFRDWQSVRIQERPEELRGGRMPRQLDCIIKDDLVDKAVPGNHMVATGVLRVFQEGMFKQRKTTFRKILFINHIEVMQKGVEETELSPEDEERIKEMAKDPWLRNLVIQSISPSIYGYEPVKEGIALQLFGCSPVELPDGARIRGDTHILLTGDPGCLVADERIVLGNGAIVKIGELGSEHLQPLKQQVLTGQGYRRDTATRFHAYRDQPILEIVTETGKSIKGTFNHPLLVMEKQRSRRFPCPPVRVWRRMDEIRLGDRVVTVPWIPCSITAPVETGWRKLDRKSGPRPRCRLPARLDKEVAALLGYMLGDGWVRRYRIGFQINHEEKDLLPILSSILERKFGLSPKVRTVKPKRTYLGEREILRKHPLVEAEAHSVDVAANLYFLREKRVPNLVLRSGNDVVAEFLAWLFEADGCVFSKGRGRRGIQLKAKNIELLRDVQMLLLRYAIHSRIVENNLTIRRARSIFKFSKAIGFRSKKKCTKLDKLVVDCQNLDPGKCRGKQLSERVVIVRPAGRADVYDIEVPGSHRFIANGVVSHNTAKSEMLKWVSQVAPRGLFTSGKKATGAGLTATAVRDEIGGGWTLEAGALVITDGGLCCIDEFDKMSDEDRGAILESLEQQTISVAKAGIIATLNTRTSVLSAANPKGGRFDRQRLISEQIDLPPVILSRFDLIFVMRDEPSAERDRTIAHHMLELHREPNRVVKPPLDVDTLRKLIIYARKNIDPKFEDEEVLKTIENFYVKWRSVAESGESPVPITPRQLEALIRLAKANARMRLSDHVTVEDANRAIKIVSFYLREAGVDTETGKIDIDVLMTGKSRSQREKLQRVLDIIKELETEYGGAAPVEQIKRVAETDGISTSFVEKMIEEELRRGHLYEPKQGMVSRTVK